MFVIVSIFGFRIFEEMAMTWREKEFTIPQNRA
jgi:hypothetical protein